MILDVFKCKMTIDCNKSPTVMKITMDGEVVKHFFKNRIGGTPLPLLFYLLLFYNIVLFLICSIILIGLYPVCLLNPLQGCVGMPCEVNGSVKSHFPDTVSLLTDLFSLAPPHSP